MTAKVRVCLLLVVVGLWPAAARAQGGFWDFIESFSGPGPSNGLTIKARLLCVDADKTTYWACFNDNRESVRWVLTLETSAGRLSTGDNERFADTPNDKRPVKIYKFGGTMAYRFHPMVDIGAGLGFFTYSGEGVTQPPSMTATPISIQFSPLAWRRREGKQPKWARIVNVTFSESFRTQVTAANFSSVSSYRKAGEFVNDVVLGVDLGGYFPWPRTR